MTFFVQYETNSGQWATHAGEWHSADLAVDVARGYRIARVVPRIVNCPRPRKRGVQLVPGIDVYEVRFTSEFLPLTHDFAPVQHFTSADDIERLLVARVMEYGGQIVRVLGEPEVYSFTPDHTGRGRAPSFFVAYVHRVPLRWLIREEGNFRGRFDKP